MAVHSQEWRVTPSLSWKPPLSVLAILGLVFLIGCLDGLVAAAAVAVGCGAFAFCLARGGSTTARWLGLGYVLGTLVLGDLTAPLLIPGSISGLDRVGEGYALFLCGAAIPSVLRLRQPGRPQFGLGRARLLRPNPGALVAAAVFGLAGWFVIVGRSFHFSAFVTNPQAARQVFSAASPSAYGWTAYRMLVVLGLLAYAAGVRAPTRARRHLSFGVTLVTLVLLSSYGSRLLPASLLLAIAVFRHRSVAAISWAKGVGVLLLVVLAATWYAGYRYFAFYGQPFTAKTYAVTMARQVGGGTSDASLLVSKYGVGEPYVREVMSSALVNSIVPKFIQGTNAPAQYPDFGAFASAALGQTRVGGIRVGVASEALLSFGFIGALLFGLAFGALLTVSDVLLSGSELWLKAAGALLLSQVVYVSVTGAANITPALAASAFGAVLLRWGMARADLAAPPPRLEAPRQSPRT